ncbi:iron ABC transporter permease [Brenneria goodwinii]|uniref:ABC transporter permease n=1 Tax=Brenneria goodwinii TaxID=1109412 RepID=UPI000EF2880C|nr:iron ABC transporter permease [Brenneria goodwinii]MCG8156774.1 iron ABC transporter permease [Brenneria goodwinii]MCG8160254.1 iron ABC transporter permease [Brenneria goodwinii]MCG8164777.1 iron ABC transporter permease [Brenneria goodwinii]MCG8172285.1 iron ABC transporter permease [Brenneria goodwinii]MCG8174044.1 iron ABC transporter permease [Brenneria goodwinii]
MTSEAINQVEPSWWYRLRHRFAIARHEPANLIGIVLILLFTWIILAPVLSILLDAIVVQNGDSARVHAAEGAFTDYYLLRTLTSRMSELLLWTPLINTLALAASTVFGALVIGVTLAWLVNRTDMAGRKWFATALIVPFMLPSWTFALAWTTLFKNHTVGGQPGWLETLGFHTPDWLAYGYFPIVSIMVLHYAPLVILIVGNALKRMDTQLEDCARVLGASRKIIAFRIVVPLVRPALLSAALLIFADCIGEFAIPYILGLPVHFDTLSTGLYRALGSRQTGVAAVIAAVIMLMGMITLLLDMRMLREAKRFVTVSGKGGMDRRRQLGRWRFATSGIALVFVLLGVVIPLLTLFFSTIMKLPGRFTADNFTFDFWIGHNLDTVALHNGILITPDFWRAVWNTVIIVGSASLASGVLGLLVGYAVMRCSIRWVGGFLRQITFLPYLVPGIAFAAAFLSLFAVARGPVPALYGTPLILVIALIAEKMPYASRSGIAAMTQLGKEPEEAARIAGAGWFTRIGRIVIPIQAAPLTTGILLPFISGIKGVSLFIILAIPATDVLTTYSLRLIDYNYQQAANAVVLMIALISWAGTVLIQKISGTGLAEGLEN